MRQLMKLQRARAKAEASMFPKARATEVHRPIYSAEHDGKEAKEERAKAKAK